MCMCAHVCMCVHVPFALVCLYVCTHTHRHTQSSTYVCIFVYVCVYHVPRWPDGASEATRWDTGEVRLRCPRTSSASLFSVQQKHLKQKLNKKQKATSKLQFIVDPFLLSWFQFCLSKHQSGTSLVLDLSIYLQITHKQPSVWVCTPVVGNRSAPLCLCSRRPVLQAQQWAAWEPPAENCQTWTGPTHRGSQTPEKTHLHAPQHDREKPPVRENKADSI